MITPQHIIQFWFNEIDSSYWWKKDNEFDQLIRQQYLSLHTQASLCELYHWRASAQGRLAEIIVLDQFSRNLFRDTLKAFTQDALALALAQEAIALKLDQQLEDSHKSFLYMPFMHSESQLIHEQAVKLYNQPGLEYNYEFELKHKIIIDRFGRYPHRNNILGRHSTAEELEFLQQPGSSF